MLSEIQDAINLIIVNKYPDPPVEINSMGVGFERPSFLIKFITCKLKSINKLFYRLNCSFQIVYFAPDDQYKNPNKLDQLSVHATLLQAFSKGYIRVNDRAVKITDINGGPRDKDIYLTLDLETTDVKEQDLKDIYDIAGDVIIS